MEEEKVIQNKEGYNKDGSEWDEKTWNDFYRKNNDFGY